MASEQAFAIWLTGLPASGKSTIARSLKARLAALGIDCAVLESDELRKVLTPDPRYDAAERDRFYRAMIYIGALLAHHGVPVIFDATANRRIWRDCARGSLARFLEVYVECPLGVAMARDPKGIYKRGRAEGGTVPGLGEVYEAPENPEIVIHGDRENPDDAADRIVLLLAAGGFIPHRKDSSCSP